MKLLKTMREKSLVFKNVPERYCVLGQGMIQPGVISMPKLRFTLSIVVALACGSTSDVTACPGPYPFPGGYPEEIRAECAEAASVVLKAVVKTARFGEPGDRIDSVIAGDDDIHFLVIFRVEEVLKGEYAAEELNVAVHSPSLTFGVLLQEGGSGEVPNYTYKLYLLKAVDQNQKEIYVMIGSEVL